MCLVWCINFKSQQEMLDEWRPLMCPNSDAINDAFFYFALFLPTYNVLEYREQG